MEPHQFTKYPVKLACVMVGLPARGKTYIARKIVRYLTWLGYSSKIFNIGNYRRDAVGATQPHDFFDPSNPDYARKRMELAIQALEDMSRWFEEEEEIAQRQAVESAQAAVHSAATSWKSPSRESFSAEISEVRPGGSGFVAVYDATNSTIERRKIIVDHCMRHNIQVMFVESICNNEDVILQNIREVKLSSPDYVGFDPAQAVQDFVQRIRHYEKAYQTITLDEKVAFIKLMNAGQQVHLHKIRGYLQSRIVYFLMNLNITTKNIYFCRHGESENNVIGKLGGDTDLSHAGWEFARKLPEFFDDVLRSTPIKQPDFVDLMNDEESTSPGAIERVTVWTSSLKRTIQTASFLRFPKMQWVQLDELDGGACDNLTYEEIAEKFPEEFRERDLDKFNYRYKGGESYRDLVQRLEPVIMELERHHEFGHSIFIIGHQAVLRCIYAYFMNYSQEELPYLNIPLHTVIKLTPKAYGCEEVRYQVDVPAVDTYRPKPENIN